VPIASRKLVVTVHGIIAVVVIFMALVLALLVAVQLPVGVSHEVVHCARAPIFVQPATHLGVGHPLEEEEEA
jgi:hypothetical protein